MYVNKLSQRYQESIWSWTWDRLKAKRLADIEQRFIKPFDTWVLTDRNQLTSLQGTDPDIPIYTGSLGEALDLVDGDITEIWYVLDLFLDYYGTESNTPTGFERNLGGAIGTVGWSLIDRTETNYVIPGIWAIDGSQSTGIGYDGATGALAQAWGQDITSAGWAGYGGGWTVNITSTGTLAFSYGGELINAGYASATFGYGSKVARNSNYVLGGGYGHRFGLYGTDTATWIDYQEHYSPGTGVTVNLTATANTVATSSAAVGNQNIIMTEGSFSAGNHNLLQDDVLGVGYLFVTGSYNRIRGRYSLVSGIMNEGEGEGLYILGQNVHIEAPTAGGLSQVNFAGGYGKHEETWNPGGIGATYPMTLKGDGNFMWTSSKSRDVQFQGNESVLLGGYDVQSDTLRQSVVLLGLETRNASDIVWDKTTYVENLALLATPTAGSPSDYVLVRDATTGLVQQTLIGGLTSSGYHKYIITDNSFSVGQALAEYGGVWQQADTTLESHTAQGIVVDISGGNATIIRFGQLSLPAHGYTLNSWYWLNEAGSYVDAEPDEDITQVVFYVDTDGMLHLNVENPQGNDEYTPPVYDNYESWELQTDSVFSKDVVSGGIVDLIGGDGIDLTYASDSITIDSTYASSPSPIIYVTNWNEFKAAMIYLDTIGGGIIWIAGIIYMTEDYHWVADNVAVWGTNNLETGYFEIYNYAFYIETSSAKFTNVAFRGTKTNSTSTGQTYFYLVGDGSVGRLSLDGVYLREMIGTRTSGTPSTYEIQILPTSHSGQYLALKTGWSNTTDGVNSGLSVYKNNVVCNELVITAVDGAPKPGHPTWNRLYIDYEEGSDTYAFRIALSGKREVIVNTIGTPSYLADIDQIVSRGDFITERGEKGTVLDTDKILITSTAGTDELEYTTIGDITALVLPVGTDGQTLRNDNGTWVVNDNITDTGTFQNIQMAYGKYIGEINNYGTSLLMRAKDDYIQSTYLQLTNNTYKLERWSNSIMYANIQGNNIALVLGYKTTAIDIRTNSIKALNYTLAGITATNHLTTKEYVDGLVGGGIPTGTADGQLLFFDTANWIASSITELYWDNTNKILEAQNIAVPYAGTGASNKYYIGDDSTDNSWRWFIDADGNLSFEKRITGVWTYSGKFSITT